VDKGSLTEIRVDYPSFAKEVALAVARARHQVSLDKTAAREKEAAGLPK
jgi:hypothetical protein